MLYLLLLLGLLLCAAQAIRAPRLLFSTLWLAGASALLAILLYALGARELAAIELSVGLALVTVLLVFAIAITGEIGPSARALIPRPLAGGLVALAAALLCWMIWPWPAPGAAPAAAPTFAEALWRQRGMDVLVQVAIIFAGAIGVLGLLAAPEPAAPPEIEPIEQSIVSQPAPDEPVGVGEERAEVLV